MLYRLSVWLHLIAACVWVGGILFFALVLVPIVRRGEAGKGAALVREVGLQFRPVGWGALGVLVVTGLTNLVARYSPTDLGTAAFWSSEFGTALLLKLALVALVVAVTVAHDRIGPMATAAATRSPGSDEARRLRVLASWLGRADALLALLVLLVAVMLVRGWP